MKESLVVRGARVLRVGVAHNVTGNEEQIDIGFLLFHSLNEGFSQVLWWITVQPAQWCVGTTGYIIWYSLGTRATDTAIAGVVSVGVVHGQYMNITHHCYLEVLSDEGRYKE